MEFIESPKEVFSTPRSIDSTSPISQHNQIATPPISKVKPTGGAKFSFSGFGKSNIIKPIIQPQIVVTEVEVKPVETISSEDITIFIGKKISYNGIKKPRIDEATRKTANWGDLMLSQGSKTKEQQQKDRKREKELEIERKNATADVMDFFGNVDTEFIVEEPVNNNLLVGKVADLIDKMGEYEVVGKKDKSTGNATLASEFFTMLYDVFEYLNPEERGRLLITIIFGGLISRAKFSGRGAGSASNKFKDIIIALNNITKGGQNSNIDRVYTKISEIICSSKLNKYRSDVTVAEQVNNVLTLVTKLANSKRPIYFPSNLLFSDPVGVIGSKITKSVALIGTPIIENLNDFFANEQKIVAKSNTVKKNSNGNDEFDQEDNLTYSAYNS
jgi:hypothetical protein